MRGTCKVFLIGRLGRDPELRTSARSENGWSVLSIATDRARRDGEAWVDETHWHRVAVFGRDAVLAHEQLRKGDPVAIEGTLVYEKWTDGEGRERRTPKILADRLTFLTPRRSEAPADAEATETQAA